MMSNASVMYQVTQKKKITLLLFITFKLSQKLQKLLSQIWNIT